MKKVIQLFIMLSVLMIGSVVSAETNHTQTTQSSGLPTIIVNSDDDDGYLPGVSCTGANECTLRQAIIHATYSLNDERINFDLTNFPNGMVIEVNSPLPELESELKIDGIADSGASCATASSPPDLRVTIDGSNAGAGADGLRLSYQNTVHGVSIVNFSDDGIYMPATYIGNNGVAVDGGLNVVSCSYIGLTPDGNAAGNDTGIKIDSDDNRVGATSHIEYVAERNIIAGNSGSGVWTTAIGNDNTINGNYIGFDPTGVVPRGNGRNGIFDDGSATIKGNVIGYNALYGLNLDSASTVGGTLFTETNLIGLGSNGLAAPNGSGGILLTGNNATIINNVVSGNTDDGIQSEGNNAVIEQNYVGVSADGLSERPNADTGILISGGYARVRDNVVSGNGGDGIIVSTVSAGSPNLIESNIVGSSPDETMALGNGDDGIVITTALVSVIANTISANVDDGLVVVGEDVLVQGNTVGTNNVDLPELGNGEDGIQLEGDDATVHENVVTENADNGIRVLGDRANIFDNLIGINAAMNLPGGNGASGIRLEGSSALVGGFASADGNIIVANGSHGITISGSSAIGNDVRNNLIGTAGLANNGTLENDGNGISIESGANGNKIGALGNENTITNNEKSGINLLGVNSINNNLRHNFIYDNAALGIDLRDVGEAIGTVTFNDANDIDTGPNNLQNWMILNSAESSGRLIGSLAGPNTPFDIDIYQLDSCDGSGYGEGSDTLIATFTQTPSGGILSFNEVLSPAPPLGKYLTALVTDGDGNTSEFSNCVPVIESGFVVNDNGNLKDQTPGDGVCAIAFTGKCTLRAAIEEINALGGGPYVISFDFGFLSGQARVIAPDDTSKIPIITVPVILDATTVTDATCPTINSAANHRVILDGSDLSSGYGLRLAPTAGGSTVRGLHIRNFPGDGIQVAGGDSTVACNTFSANKRGINLQSANNRIGGTAASERNVIVNHTGNGIRLGSAATHNKVQGNYVGVSSDGVLGASNGENGVFIDGGSTNRIGGSVGYAANVISNNQEHGILIGSGGSNQIWGNLIGLDAAGTIALGNGFSGIHIDGANANEIGGDNDGKRNVIANSGLYGIFLNSSGNVISRNYIGTDSSGTVAHGSMFSGVSIQDGDNNVVGGETAADGNLIAANGSMGIYLGGNAVFTDIRFNSIGVSADDEPLGNGSHGIILADFVSQATVRNNVIAHSVLDGIAVESSVGLSNFASNQIYANGGLGIDLNADLVANPNDSGDVDSGANGLMNHPIIIDANADTGFFFILLDSLAPRDYRIHVYRNSSCGADNVGQGERFVSSFDLTIAAGGSTVIMYNTTLSGFNTGDLLTATATPLTSPITDGTSEFSPCFAAKGSAPTAVQVSEQITVISGRWWVLFVGLVLVTVWAIGFRPKPHTLPHRTATKLSHVNDAILQP